MLYSLTLVQTSIFCLLLKNLETIAYNHTNKNLIKAVLIKSFLTYLYNQTVNLLVFMRPKLYYYNMLIKQSDSHLTSAYYHEGYELLLQNKSCSKLENYNEQPTVNTSDQAVTRIKDSACFSIAHNKNCDTFAYQIPHLPNYQ